MRLQLITPEEFQWLDGYYKELSKKFDVLITNKPEKDTSGVMVFLWCNQDTFDYIMEEPKQNK